MNDIKFSMSSEMAIMLQKHLEVSLVFKGWILQMEKNAKDELKSLEKFTST